MPRLLVQISPEVKSAYFADHLNVCRAELSLLLPEAEPELVEFGPLKFFAVEAEPAMIQPLLRLSFSQGLFEAEGDLLKPLSEQAEFHLHEDFVFGSKYKGKTNERLTQLLINVGLAGLGKNNGEGLKLLDPMAGRATSLLWGMRYGFKSFGIELDAKALGDVERNMKKWCKLHRQKHKFSNGQIKYSAKKSSGRFIDFHTDFAQMRLATGDARQCHQIYSKDKFDLMVSDLPYGVQHGTVNDSRDPLAVLPECAPSWKKALKKNGLLVLAFNNYNPKRQALIECFEQAGFKTQPFSAPHRMSESIKRDVVVFKQS